MHFETKTFGLLPEFHHHLGTTDALRIAGEILDVRSQHQLTAGHVPGEHEGLQHRTSGIQAGRVSSGAGADDDDLSYAF